MLLTREYSSYTVIVRLVCFPPSVMWHFVSMRFIIFV